MATDEHMLLIGTSKIDVRPEHIGPGYWRALHQWAYVHDTSDIANSREMFIDNIVRGTGEHFECMNCRGHAIEYMNKTDPVRNILKLPKLAGDGSILLVCLAWTYRFHEAVNERLKKPSSQRPTFSQLDRYLSDLREGKGCNNCGPIGLPDTQLPPLPAPRVIRRLVVD